MIKMKNEIILMIIIVIVAMIFGCTNNSQSQKNSKVYGSTNINFQMPEGWEVHPMPGKGTVIWMKGDPRIRVIEYTDKQKYDSDYNKDLNIDNSNYAVSNSKKIINGVQINVIKTTHNNNGDIQDEYFFEKNNKYYNLECWAFPGWNSKKTNTARLEIEKAVNIIVNTIK